jgi:hypothetical protein
MTEETHVWDPMSIEDAAELMSGVNIPWWVAGGWAIDLFLGRQTRAHGDTDILIRRDDQLVVQEHLSCKGLLLYKTQQPGLKPWLPGEFQSHPFDDIWCRWTSESPWVLQLMLLSTEGDQWVFKRDPAIRGPLEGLGLQTLSGIPYMCPHIQLLHKAKRDTLAKDQSDFDLAAPRMQPEEQRWLLSRLEGRFPDGHQWIDQLRGLLEQHLSPPGSGLNTRRSTRRRSEHREHEW